MPAAKEKQGRKVHTVKASTRPTATFAKAWFFLFMGDSSLVTLKQ
jgi:hypothetical protein